MNKKELNELQQHIQEFYEYVEGVFFYKKVRANRNKIGQKVSSYDPSTGYEQIKIGVKKYYAHRLIFLYHYGYLPKYIDHIDQNKQNNNIENLREVTHAENMRNVKKPKTNTSGYKGVYWHNQLKKWRAQVRINNKHKHLGLFDTPEKAYQAYCEFVKQNFIIYCLENEHGN